MSFSLSASGHFNNDMEGKSQRLAEKVKELFDLLHELGEGDTMPTGQFFGQDGVNLSVSPVGLPDDPPRWQVFITATMLREKLQSRRTKMATGSGSRSVKPAKGRTGGRQTVQYRDVKGFTHNAVVEGGTGTVLDLFVPHLPAANRHKTGILKATTAAQTNRWF